MKEIKEIYKKARKINSCSKFTGNESFRELIDLLFSPQGIEFCVNNNFPDINYFDKFSREDLWNSGIFVDAGTVEVENVKNVLAVGNTELLALYNNQDHVYNVVVLHGGKAFVTADNYSVVKLSGDESRFKTEKFNNSIIL